MEKLKCYQVGEFDLVVAYNEKQAFDILVDFVGCSSEDIDDVIECSNEFLSKPTIDEDGVVGPSWGEIAAKIDKPEWVGGWE